MLLLEVGCSGSTSEDCGAVGDPVPPWLEVGAAVVLEAPVDRGRVEFAPVAPVDNATPEAREPVLTAPVDLAKPEASEPKPAPTIA